MDSQQTTMERLLATLGEARQDGVFKSDAARYPWQNEQVRVQKPAARRFAWLRIGGPVAAAAAVAVLFVGPNLFPDQAKTDIATTVHTHLDTERPEALANADASSVETLPCDINGDGLINGQDIQGIVDRRVNGEGSQEEVNLLMQCLLGG